MEYVKLKADEINRELFSQFIRHQKVTQCWRKINNKWCIENVSFIDDWSENNYQELIIFLKNVVFIGGVAFGAFTKGILKGFSSVDPVPFGKNNEYLDLTDIHVSEDMRGKGLGKNLFQLSKEWAKEHGAKKLYISAHSAVESQAFYKAMGCVEALEYSQTHTEKEPFDCQLECIL